MERLRIKDRQVFILNYAALVCEQSVAKRQGKTTKQTPPLKYPFKFMHDKHLQVTQGRATVGTCIHKQVQDECTSKVC